jgi:hypothetical protein
MTSRDQPPKPFQTPAWLACFLHLGIGVVFLIMILQINRRITTGHSGDFRHFYFAAGALLDHRDLYGSVPMDVERAGLGRAPTPDEIDWYTTNTDRYLYPPLIALLYTPLARLRMDHAQRIMLIVNSLFAWGGVVLVARSFVIRFSLPRESVVIALIALMGLLLNEDKVHGDLQMFQTNSLMFLMFAIALALLDRKPILAGFPLGVIMNIKYLSLPMLPWLILRRRWGTAAGCIASSVLFALLPAVISGWQQNLHNLAVAYGGLAHMVGVQGGAEQANVDDIRNYLSCSITSAMARTTRKGESLVKPMIYTAGVAAAAAGLVMARYRLARIAIFLWPDRQQQESSPWPPLITLEFAALIAVTLCFSPQTNTRHLMLATFITLALSTLIFCTKSWLERIMLVIAAIAIAYGFTYPPGGQDSHRQEMFWFGIGGQCWCLLFAVLVMLFVGVSSASELRRSPDAGSERTREDPDRT